MPRSKNRDCHSAGMETQLKNPPKTATSASSKLENVDAEMRKRKAEEKNREKGTNSDTVCGT